MSTLIIYYARLTRVILIKKMRGIDHSTQPHPYAITKQGMQVFPKEKSVCSNLQWLKTLRLSFPEFFIGCLEALKIYSLNIGCCDLW
jgi:hypothetical protein